jgi:hypothetical protein
LIKKYIFKPLSLIYLSFNEFAEKREEFSKLEPIASGTYYSKKYKKEMTYKVVVI